MTLVEWGFIIFIAFVIGLSLGRKLQVDEFKPYIHYWETVGMTEIVLEDAATVWCPLNHSGHSVDLGYAMDDGRLVGIQIWKDVRYRPNSNQEYGYKG